MYYEDRSVATEHKHADDSHQFVIAHPVVQWWNRKMVVFMLCLIFQFMELNERDSDRSYGGVIFRMRNISQRGSTLLMWGLIKETTLTRFHENCWKYWSNFTESLITLCHAAKYYNCKDASLGRTLSEKVWKQCMSLTSLLLLVETPKLSENISVCVLSEIRCRWTWAKPCPNYEHHNVSTAVINVHSCQLVIVQ